MIAVKRLSLDDAKAVLAAAEKEAKEIGVPMAIAVTDESGNLLAFQRMDGAKFTSIGIAIDKAYTAAGVRRPTRDLAKVAAPGASAFGIHNANGGRMMVFGGGVPILVDGAVVGAVGVSSGTAEQDHQVAEAGVAAVTARA